MRIASAAENHLQAPAVTPQQQQLQPFECVLSLCINVCSQMSLSAVVLKSPLGITHLNFLANGRVCRNEQPPGNPCCCL